jgi:hypothetical protein
MSVTIVRSQGSLLKQAVLLALGHDSKIISMDDIPSYTYLDNYILCERKSDQSLIGIKTDFSNIQFTEHTNNTKYRKYSIFHTFKCQQYPIDSEKDKQQIEHLANLILKFCRERMNDNQLDNFQSSPKRSRAEIDLDDFDDYIDGYSRMKMARF